MDSKQNVSNRNPVNPESENLQVGNAESQQPEQLIQEGNRIISKIDIINIENRKLQEWENAREKEILGITLDECNTTGDIEKYEQLLYERGNLLDTDYAINRILKRKMELLEQKSNLIGQLHSLLCKISDNFKEIKPYMIMLHYEEIRNIFKGGKSGATA